MLYWSGGARPTSMQEENQFFRFSLFFSLQGLKKRLSDFDLKSMNHTALIRVCVCVCSEMAVYTHFDSLSRSSGPCLHSELTVSGFGLLISPTAGETVVL